MATPEQAQQTGVQVRRTFAAPREKVFQAWTEPALLAQWMGKTTPTQQVTYHELDVRPGGNYHIETLTPEGYIYRLHGTYREIRPLEKLVFTWQWKRTAKAGGDVEEIGETLVTVEFFARGDSTEVVLTHEGFTKAEIRDRHDRGWNGCFDTLTRVLQEARG